MGRGRGTFLARGSMMWKQLSEELQAATAKTAAALVHVGGPGIPGRTALVWADGLVVTLARQAADGESVPVVLPGGAEGEATVHAWDPRTGLAVLKVPDLKAPAWVFAPQPAVGSLVLTVAFPSPQGIEARLDLVRYSGGASEWGQGVVLGGLIQTDGSAYPGFTGAAIVDPNGALVGFVAENRPGNGGFVVPSSDLAKLIETLVTSGSPKRAWLGVSTRPAGGQGLVLLGVDAPSPAATAGWLTGDLLVSLADQPLKDPATLVEVLATLVPGQTAPARLLRNGQVLDLPVVPGGR